MLKPKYKIGDIVYHLEFSYGKLRLYSFIVKNINIGKDEITYNSCTYNNKNVFKTIEEAYEDLMEKAMISFADKVVKFKKTNKIK